MLIIYPIRCVLDFACLEINSQKGKSFKVKFIVADMVLGLGYHRMHAFII